VRPVRLAEGIYCCPMQFGKAQQNKKKEEEKALREKLREREMEL